MHGLLMGLMLAVDAPTIPDDELLAPLVPPEVPAATRRAQPVKPEVTAETPPVPVAEVPPPAPASAAPQGDSVALPAGAMPTSSAARAPGPSGPKWVPLSLMGAGVAAGVTATVFGMAAKSDYERFETALYQNDKVRFFSSASAGTQAAGVAFVAAGLCLISGAVLHFVW